MLENLAAKLGTLDLCKDSSEQNSQARPKSGRSPNSNSDVTAVDSPAQFEGETTLNTQSGLARDLLERALVSTPAIGDNSEIKAALKSLQNLVTKQKNPSKTSEYSYQWNPPSGLDGSQLELPPWESVESVLEKALRMFSSLYLAFRAA